MKIGIKKQDFIPALVTSKFRFWFGLFITIILSFSFYNVLVIIRDFLRMLTFTSNFNYLELTQFEHFFYNLFYAYLALIFGQTYFLKIIFDINKQVGDKSIQFKRKKIVHDQNILIWFFLFWFLKLSFFYGIMNANAFASEESNFSIFDHISFIDEYPILFVLIIIILFLQSWQSISLTFRKHFKFLFISFACISILALGFSQINLIDFESDFNKQKANNPFIKHNIALPTTTFSTSLFARSNKLKLYISKKGTIFYNGEKISDFALNKILVDFQNANYRGFDKVLQLNVDENLTMEKFKKLNSLWKDFPRIKVCYTTYPEIMLLSKAHYQDQPYGLFERNNKKGKTLNVAEDIANARNIINLKLNSSGEVLLNNFATSNSKIVKTIKNSILENKNHLIVFHLDENALFSNYIKLLEIARQGHLEAFQSFPNEFNYYGYITENADDELDFNVVTLYN